MHANSIAGSSLAALPTPPGPPGLPLIGNALDFKRDPVAFIRRAYETLGPVFSVRLGPQRGVVLLGPEACRFFVAETDHVLSVPEVYRFIVPMFGRVLNACQPIEYQRHRDVLLPAFNSQRLPGYVEVMIEQTLAWLDRLGDSGTLELCGSLERLSMAIGATTMLGRDFYRFTGPRFWELYRDIARGMEVILPPNLPLPRFWRRDRARRQLHALLRPVVRSRRTNPEGHADFLQAMALATDADGRMLPEDTLIGLILIMVFGAYETTAAQASWTLIQLLQHPHYLSSVLDELTGVLGERPGSVDPERLRRLERLEWAIKESERLRPVTTVLSRYTAQPYEFGGYRVPRGWLTFVSPAVSHRLPESFTDPDAYDPERFAPARAADRRDAAGMLTFGGGLHRCLGMTFARYEMKVVLSLLLGQYALELAGPEPRPEYSHGVTRPTTPTLIRYRRRETAAILGTKGAYTCPHQLASHTTPT